MQTSQLDSCWISTRCGAVSRTSAALPSTALLPHTRGFVGRAVTQREVKPHQGSTRDQRESVKTGAFPCFSWQEIQAHLLQGQAPWKAWNSWLGLLSTARLVSFHSSSQIPVFPPGCAVGRLLGVQPVQQQPLLPFPKGWVRRSQMVEPSSIMCHVQFLTGSKTGGHPPKYPN